MEQINYLNCITLLKFIHLIKKSFYLEIRLKNGHSIIQKRS